MKHRIGFLSIAVVAAAIVNAETASAKLDVCQAKIETNAIAYETAITKALQGCKNAVRKEEVKNAASSGSGSVASAAKTCEKLLANVYGMPGGPVPFTGKTAVQKFREKWVQLRTGKCKVGGAPCSSNAACGANGPCNAQCTDEDLASLGHLLSGFGFGSDAPPQFGDAGKFTCDWIMIAKEKLALKQQLFLIPDTLQLLQTMIEAAPEKVNISGVAAKKGTQCSPTFNANTEEYRPNLCRFGIECRDHACQLDVAQSFSNLISAPLNGLIGPQTLPLSGRVTMEMCTMGPLVGTCHDAPNGPCSTDADCFPPSGTNACSLHPQQGLGNQFGAEPGFMYLINEPSRTLKVTVPGALAGLGVEAICVDSVRSEGWCDCTGHGLLNNVDLCIDQSLSDNPGLTDDCGAATSDATESPLYQGTKNGALKTTLTGASSAGSCLDQATLQFKFVGTGQAGPDTVDCTNDDYAAPSAPVSFPVTTGTAHTSVKDAVASPSSCAVALNSLGGARDCQDNVNCNYCSGNLGKWCATPGSACGGPDGTCTADLPCFFPTLVNISSATLNGAVGGGCAAYQTSNLSGLKLVGAFPTINAPPPIGDDVQAFALKCQ
ncbi:MAG: hypothetical protein HY270_01115 [Deltaproteobacteria bacterium]|nr:hypothetical protein [Deltaproteobacteria bacterium]